MLTKLMHKCYLKQKPLSMLQAGEISNEKLEFIFGAARIMIHKNGEIIIGNNSGEIKLTATGDIHLNNEK